MNPPSGTVFRTSRNTVSPSRSRTKPTSSSSPSTTGFPQFLLLKVQVKCTIYQLRQSPPLAPAIALSVPLSILWRQGNRFYGSFSAWMGYKAEIEAVRHPGGRMSYTLRPTPVWVAMPGYRILPPEAADTLPAAEGFRRFRTDLQELTGAGL